MIPTLALVAATMLAAPADSLPYGETVRAIPSDAPPVTGTLVRQEERAYLLRLEDGSYRTFPETSDLRLQVREKRPSKAGTGFAIGAAIGLTGGVVAGLIAGDDGPSGGFDFTPSKSEAALGLGLAGFLVGGGIGALVGASMGGDTWVDIPLGDPAESAERVQLGVQVGPDRAALRCRRRF